MTGVRERRPVGDQAPNTFSSRNAPSIPVDTPEVAAAALITGVHVVVVETPAGKYRRRVYLSLKSAQLAADRAAMAGHPASLILCQLIPVTAGGESL